jgi:hypothetical protein
MSYAAAEAAAFRQKTTLQWRQRIAQSHNPCMKDTGTVRIGRDSAKHLRRASQSRCYWLTHYVCVGITIKNDDKRKRCDVQKTFFGSVKGWNRIIDREQKINAEQTRSAHVKRSGSLASIKYLSSQFYRFLAHLLSHSFLFFFFFFIVCTPLPHLGRLVIKSHRHKLVIPINQSDLVTRRQPKNLVTGISKQNFSPFKIPRLLKQFWLHSQLTMFFFLVFFRRRFFQSRVFLGVGRAETGTKHSECGTWTKGKTIQRTQDRKSMPDWILARLYTTYKSCDGETQTGFIHSLSSCR